jgi:hypothetical protein
MAKPTLFWTIKPKWWAGGFEIMRVTTAKPRRYYGTTEDGENTHARAADCRGRFETREAAEARLQVVAEVRKAFADTHPVLTAARNRAEKAERQAIDAAVEGLDVDVPGLIVDPDAYLATAKEQGPNRCRQLVRFGNG